MSQQPLNIIVIPDSHADPMEADLGRYDALGNFIVEERPDVIINIGDHSDLASLSHYDRGKLNFEGRRYAEDIAVSIEANRRIFAPLRKLQRKQKKQKKRVYNPQTVMTLGNHEERINRVVSENPHMHGFMSIDDLEYEEYYDTIVDYMDSTEINGVYFSHAFVSGVMGKPIGGVNHARSLLQKGHGSMVCGHSHLVDSAEETHVSGKRLQALVVGCFVAEPPTWTNDQQYALWSSGISVLRGVANGTFDHERISLERLLSNNL